MSPALNPSSGPVAVTGASGYIGSWIVRLLVERGYTVHACVRDKSNKRKVEHLLAMNSDEASLPGRVHLFEADLFKQGSYDEAFAACAGVVHAGAAVGYNKETPQQVYDGCFTQNKHVIEAAVKAKTVQRFVFTSSGAAVIHPHPVNYIFTEDDWCDQDRDPSKWNADQIPVNRDIAYAMAKAATERMLNELAAGSGSQVTGDRPTDQSAQPSTSETTFEVFSILPSHVLGPLICENHDQGRSWQNCIRQMLQGKQHTKVTGGRMLWNVVDVRDVALAHVLCLEKPEVASGSRYLLAAANPSAELFTWELQRRLQTLFPHIAAIGGEEMDGDKPAQETNNPPFCYCTRAIKDLGIKPIDVDTTLKDTGNSYIKLGLV